jgi:hypothetical protein
LSTVNGVISEPDELVEATPLGGNVYQGTFAALSGPAGTRLISVHATDPSGNVETTTVTIVVSTGPVLVAVPNVVGLTQAAASAAITGAGLVVGTVTSASSPTVPAGSVISSTPTAGTQVRQGAAVNLVVSTGPALVAVPNVVGLTQAAASAAITGAGLVVGTVTSASSPTVPAGSVISSTPTAGTQVASGASVNLVVSTGPGAGGGAQRRRSDAGGGISGDHGCGAGGGDGDVGVESDGAGRERDQFNANGGTQVASGASVDLLISVGSSLVYSGLVQPPIDKDGSSVFSATRASLPVKFSLRTNGASTCELPPATIAVSRIAGGVVGPIDESVFIRPSDKGSTFAISDCQYVYDLGVGSFGAGKYLVEIRIGSVTVGTGMFSLK